jgi:hypothetical protein
VCNTRRAAAVGLFGIIAFPRANVPYGYPVGEGETR